jgi:N-acetylneuraminic acid mutarotase
MNKLNHSRLLLARFFAAWLLLLALNLSVTQSANATSFSTTGALIGNRAGHSATLLRNGRVLVVGGFNGTVRLTSSELYNPATGTWTATGALTTGRTTHTATLLSNGKVLATGGHVSASGSTATCELYDPATATWTATGVMATPRGNHTATLLPNGKVLVVGGFNRNTSSAVFTAELYDPVTGSWTVTGAMATARNFHTATLLLNGRVLVAGGASDGLQYASLSSTEVYDPATGVWTATGSMLSARQGHTATLLPDGRVLFAGVFHQGYFGAGAELYDPASGTSTPTGALGTARGVHTATLLPDGKVLAAGGNYNSLNAPTTIALSSVELYNPATGTWTATGSLNAARSTHVAILLPNGQVLVAAGYYVNGNVQLSSAELYDSATGPITLVNPGKQPGGAFQFTFIGVPNGTNTVLMTTDLALPLTNWTVLAVAPEFASGLFVFRDPPTANGLQRFYRVRSP